MELLFLYIKEAEGFIKEQQINFSSNYEVELVNATENKQKLIIKKKRNHLKALYGDYIKNITLLVGKNGAGKTTILDILGAKFEDRHNIKGEYFMLYKLDGEEYGIEYTGSSTLEKIENINLHTDSDEKYRNSKGIIGVIFDYQSQKLMDLRKFFSSDNNEIANRISFNYIKDIERHSDRITKKSYNHIDYIAKRTYGEKSLLESYMTLTNLNNDSSFKFNNIYNHIKFSYDFYNRIDEETEKLIKSLDLINKLGKYRTERSYFQRQRRESVPPFLFNKNMWIINLLYEIIYYTLENVLFHAETEGSEGIILDFGSRTNQEKLKGLNGNESTKEWLGKLNKSGEVANLEEVIEYLRPIQHRENFEEHYESLITILRYLNSRLETYTDFEEYNAYQIAYEEMLNLFIKIPEEHMEINKTDIIFNMRALSQAFGNEGLKELKDILRRIDFWTKRSTNADYHNQISSFKIYFDNLSEGEYNILNLLSMIRNNLVFEDNKINILLLDEPDLGLHPEWSRTFTSELKKILTSLGGNYQIVMTTHSPYLISDQVPENVYKLKRDENQSMEQINKNNLKIERYYTENKLTSCFGANIHNLYRDGFFLTNTLGELATNTIKSMLNKFEEMETLQKQEGYESIPAYVSFKEKKSEYQYFIERIGEPYLKSVLEGKLTNIFDKELNQNDKIESLLNRLSSEELEILKTKVGGFSD